MFYTQKYAIFTSRCGCYVSVFRYAIAYSKMRQIKRELPSQVYHLAHDGHDSVGYRPLPSNLITAYIPVDITTWSTRMLGIASKATQDYSNEQSKVCNYRVISTTCRKTIPERWCWCPAQWAAS